MIVFFVDHLVVAVFRGVKTAGDPHPSGPELSKVGSDQRSSTKSLPANTGQQTRFVKNTIQYDSKSKHSKRRQIVN